MRFDEASLDYHLRELEIASRQTDARRSLPDVPSRCHALLDVGCGIGQSLVALQSTTSAELHGVDIDEVAVRFGSERFPQLHLRVASGEHLPYPDQQFDLVMCRVSLPYMNIPLALSEFHRVLAPGGSLWLAVHPLSMALTDMRDAVRRLSVRAVVYRFYALTNSIALNFGRQFRYPLNPDRTESYQTRAALVRCLARAGFDRESVETSAGSSIVRALRPESA
jgi:ubiquinone/menaquinone biosynthesis C-methylase UbiE